MKRFLTRISAALIAACVVTIAVPALAQQTPVAVSNCEASMHPFDVASGYSDAHAPTVQQINQNDAYGRPYHAASSASSHFLGIAFSNTTAKPISTVDFGFVVDGKLATEVRDVGTFSPGATIQHDFHIPDDAYSATGECVPLQVMFSDGTSWKNPSLPTQ